MSPQLIIETRHPQRPWRRVESEPRRPVRSASREHCKPVVRELPPRRDW